MQRELTTRDAHIGDEVRPADEHGLVRAELEVIAEHTTLAGGNDRRPERRGGDGVGASRTTNAAP